MAQQMNKFDRVPIEHDTTILFQQTCKLSEYDVSYEIWSWDGVRGESIIFSNKDIDKLSDDEIVEKVLVSPLFKLGTTPTLKRPESGFTFVNFNFDIN